MDAYEARFRADGLLRSLHEMVRDEQRAARQARRNAEGSKGRHVPRPVRRTIPGDRSEFVADLTVPDGSRVRVGRELVKRWRLRNAGSVAWAGRYLGRVGACSGPSLITSPRRVRIPDTRPGETMDVAVAIRAPELPGSTIAYWVMVTEDGDPCYPDRYADGIYAHVVAYADEGPEPSTTEEGARPAKRR